MDFNSISWDEKDYWRNRFRDRSEHVKAEVFIAHPSKVKKTVCKAEGKALRVVSM